VGQSRRIEAQLPRAVDRLTAPEPARSGVLDLIFYPPAEPERPVDDDGIPRAAFFGCLAFFGYSAGYVAAVKAGWL
jgi:hypothetical protein